MPNEYDSTSAGTLQPSRVLSVERQTYRHNLVWLYLKFHHISFK